jgi:RimJ/RimL family protein N-acetyltransferase
VIVYDSRVLDYVNRINRQSPDCNSVGIGWEKNGEIIAALRYDSYNGTSMMMHVAAKGKRWMTKEYLFKAFHYPFVQLGLKKLLAPTEEGNLTARRFIEHIGFVLEHKIENACPSGAIYLYSMTPEQCRFLGDTYGQIFLAARRA